MSAALHEAIHGLRARRGRAILAAAGIAMAAAMLATAATVGYGLATGFSRSARAADLPDITARFDREPTTMIASRIKALPDISTFTLSNEQTGVPLSARSHRADNAVVETIGSGRRGYAIVSGHDLSDSPGGVLLQQGVATSWGLRVGDTIDVGGLGPQRIVGLAQEPDDAAYPLAAPRVYTSAATRLQVPLALPQARIATLAQRLHLSQAALLARVQALRRRVALKRGPPGGQTNLARIWLRDPRQLDAVLVQARSLSYGLRDLRFVTRSGVRVQLDQAAGIVIALLVALSVIALLTAGVLLGAAARAEVQRRLPAIGVRRAIGATRGHVTRVSALEELMLAVPAAALGVAVGALAAAGPNDRLLALLNERGPGTALAAPLAGCFMVAVLLPAVTSAWPAWRAAGRPPVELLSGAELRHTVGAAAQPRRGGLARLGGRLMAARRVRLGATLTMLGVSAAFVLLILALASELSTLENDPKALGRRYQLTVAQPPEAAAQVDRVPGVAAAAPRYELTALDSFSLGETIDVIAYPSEHTTFEAPPLVAGARLRGAGEAEVGNGLAQVLGLSVSSTLALALPSGEELRLRVAGIVNALGHDGRVAYVPAATLLAADPGAPEQIAVRLTPNADAARVSAQLAAQLGGGGASVARTQTITGQGNSLVAALTAVLRAVAVIDGLVCLYALIQTLALTAHERRGTVAVLRACGAGPGSIRTLLAGGALILVVPAGIIAILLERLVLGPEMGHIAARYVSLALAAGPVDVALLIAGLSLLATAAVWWVARQAFKQPIAEGLR